MCGDSGFEQESPYFFCLLEWDTGGSVIIKGYQCERSMNDERIWMQQLFVGYP